MKLTELEPGKTYWYNTRNDWADYDFRAHDRHPVRVETLERYIYSPPSYIPPGWTPDKSARNSPRGNFIRVIIPGDPNLQHPSDREDRVAYVQPRYIRAELEEFEVLVKRNREAKQAEQAEATRKREEAYALRDQLRARAQALGLTGLSIELGGYNGITPMAKLGPSYLAELFDRLEAAAAAWPSDGGLCTGSQKTGD